MKFRFLPKGLFKPANLPEVRASDPLKEEDRYGDDKTIHHSNVVDIEIGPDGEVCAVWFRCRMLPFTSNQVVDSRAEMMREVVSGGIPGIKAIVFATDFPYEDKANA